MATDPESEMLLSENVSNAVVSENGSVSTYTVDATSQSI